MRYSKQLISRWQPRVLFASLALVTSCGGMSATERECRGIIKMDLLNPENAEFFNFKSIDKMKFSEGVANKVWRGHNVSPSERWKFGDQLDGPINDIVKSMDGAEYYSIRVKAESRIGLKVTSQYVCAFKPQSGCGCLDADLE